MQQYYFLFGLALAWLIFATIQDLKRREVANWLTYSLIIFALGYRAFYSVFYKDAWFFIFGLAGVGILVVFAYAFYYGRVFAGGDAKLLMGLGAIIPAESWIELGINLTFFLFLLFFLGAAYSILYSFGIVYKNFIGFKEKFSNWLLKGRAVLIFLFASYLVLALVIIFNQEYDFLNFEVLKSLGYLLYILPLAFGFALLFIYLKSLEEGCLIRMVGPQVLTEGDWLERDVKVGNKWIRKSVHGLSLSEINLLKKAGKRVWIRIGVPFVPAFLIAFLVMLFLLLVLGLKPMEVLMYLSQK